MAFHGWVRFTLLGEVGAIRAGEQVDLGPPQRRAVLAALLTDAGRTVGTETLVNRVWGEEPTAGVRSTLYAHLARLRNSLTQGDCVVVQQGSELGFVT